MQTTAVTKYVRVTSKKARRVVDSFRGKRVDEALSLLSFTNYSISSPLTKTIASAAANLKVKPEGVALDDSNIYIKEIKIDKGPNYPKRFRAGARGRAKPIVKETCHITVTVENTSK
ncbi:50S ribosomal protein L22 [candidate division WOR-3 bacterium]|nr:50S ribosomal protein L22 [candidate division WOR-3 bacterium]